MLQKEIFKNAFRYLKTSSLATDEEGKVVVKVIFFFFSCILLTVQQEGSLVRSQVKPDVYENCNLNEINMVVMLSATNQELKTAEKIEANPSKLDSL